jgi:Uma2 family endonuclease
MTTSRWPDHLIGLEEWDALPEDGTRRFELAEGVLSVAPRPSPRHQRLVGLLARALDDALPTGWCALSEVEVVVDAGEPPTVRVPDVLVLRTDVVDERTRVASADVLAVAEVLSPGTRRTDRVTKLAEYAEAGISRYALLDDGPPLALTLFVLEGGRYVREAVYQRTAVVDLGFPVPLDLARWSR